ncbi:MAG TPA: TIGR02996 domain-containing protein [Gemmataceae bacterium]|nr:TIGR02996 domain-containing protein [Gemmataceae bacterium]
MNDEAAFMAMILANPDDDAPRLVFADWLDERGDRRAEWLRLTVRRDQLVRGLPAGEGLLVRIPARLRDHTEALRITRRIEKLAAVLPEAWTLRLTRGPIENCRGPADACPRAWQRLPESDQPDQRPCHECQRVVEYCRTSWQTLRVRLRDRPFVRPMTPTFNPWKPGPDGQLREGAV